MTSPLTQRAINRVQAFWRQSGLSRHELARQAGLSHYTLAQIGQDDWRPSTNTLMKIEELVPADFMPEGEAA